MGIEMLGSDLNSLYNMKALLYSLTSEFRIILILRERRPVSWNRARQTKSALKDPINPRPMGLVLSYIVSGKSVGSRLTEKRRQ
jgi:hypothetical protein